MEAINLTDQEIQSLIDARATLNKIRHNPTVACNYRTIMYKSSQAIERIDAILDDIYPGWISHLNKGC